ncbi:superoxide dismutase [Candidatus Dependentiae bacterium]
MLIKLPELPYAKNALEPHISKETLDYHYDKHHQGYVNKLNALIKNTELAEKKLEEIILQTDNPSIFNNAAQVFNHTFYWHCMTPNKQEPGQKISDLLTKTFGSLDEFKKQFVQAATTQFGSGWAWLVQKSDGTIGIRKTSNADCPLKYGEKPLLTCDVWEHAYYIDYRNGRKNYVEAWWDLINWEFVESSLS